MLVWDVFGTVDFGHVGDICIRFCSQFVEIFSVLWRSILQTQDGLK